MPKQKKKQEQIIIGSWLLELHKYIPNILPKNKNEAIGYYYFLKLLDDMFSGVLHVDEISTIEKSMPLCDKKIENSYGGDAQYFQNYLTRYFFRGDYMFTWNTKKCRLFSLHSYFIHLLLDAYKAEYKYREFRIVQKPTSKAEYSSKKMYALPFNESRNYEGFKKEYDEFYENLMEANLLSLDSNPHLKKEGYEELISEIHHTVNEGSIYLESLNELKEFSFKSNNERRQMQKTSVISLVTKLYKLGIKTDVREESYEYIEDKMVINESALKSGISTLLDNKRIFHLTALNRILYAYENGMPLVYRARKGLRLMNIAEGLSVNIQGLKKDIRETIYTSYFDYDIEASAPTILYQLYYKLNPTANELEHIKAYAEDKTIYRNALAKLILETTSTKDEVEAIKDAKTIFTAVLFGARPYSQQSTLDLEKKLQDAMKVDPLVDGLMLDVATLFSKIGTYYKKQRIESKDTKTYTITNPFGTTISIDEKWKNTKVVSLLYQSIERHILDLVVKKYGDRVILKVHDGFITNEKIDTEELQEYILSNTSYLIKYEYKSITTPSTPLFIT